MSSFLQQNKPPLERILCFGNVFVQSIYEGNKRRINQRNFGYVREQSIISKFQKLYVSPVPNGSHYEEFTKVDSLPMDYIIEK
jgi:hypothetical protein